MYENYLLDSEAIAAVINRKIKHLLLVERSQAWLDKRNRKDFAYPKMSKEIKSPLLDGLRKSMEQTFLRTVIEFSQKRVEFSKTRHSYMLTSG
jgi:hypothetical protein